MGTQVLAAIIKECGQINRFAHQTYLNISENATDPDTQTYFSDIAQAELDTLEEWDIFYDIIETHSLAPPMNSLDSMKDMLTGLRELAELMASFEKKSQNGIAASNPYEFVTELESHLDFLPYIIFRCLIEQASSEFATRESLEIIKARFSGRLKTLNLDPEAMCQFCQHLKTLKA